MRHFMISLCVFLLILLLCTVSYFYTQTLLKTAEAYVRMTLEKLEQGSRDTAKNTLQLAADTLQEAQPVLYAVLPRHSLDEIETTLQQLQMTLGRADLPEATQEGLSLFQQLKGLRISEKLCFRTVF